jgi:hypothetical protein
MQSRAPRSRASAAPSAPLIKGHGHARHLTGHAPVTQSAPEDPLKLIHRPRALSRIDRLGERGLATDSRLGNRWVTHCCVVVCGAMRRAATTAGSKSVTRHAVGREGCGKLQRDVGTTRRNHNPCVGGSNPSSATNAFTTRPCGNRSVPARAANPTRRTRVPRCGDRAPQASAGARKPIETIQA